MLLTQRLSVPYNSVAHGFQVPALCKTAQGTGQKPGR